MNSREIITRIVVLTLGTIFGGAICGNAAVVSFSMLGMGATVRLLPFALIYGGLVGCVACFFTVPLLFHKRMAIALMLAFVPALIAAVLSGIQFPLHRDPWSIPISFGTLVAASILINRWMPDQFPPSPPEHLCADCGYDLRGLLTKTCPECGSAAATPSPASSPPPPLASP